MSILGQIEAICISDQKGTHKTEINSGVLLENLGLEGDAHAGLWHRQVSLLDAADIDSMRKVLPDLQPGAFGENLVITNLNLAGLGLGSSLRIGQTAELTVTQRGKSCHSRCAIYYQTGDCIMPRRGLFARVLKGGTISVGDIVEVVQTVSPEKIQAVVLTISDKGYRGERIDTAGPAVAELLENRLPAHIYALEILPDERNQIADRLRHYADGHNIDLVVAVGGTGFSPRDVTPEAIRDVAERLTPGLDEAMRFASSAKSKHSMLSRAVSGIAGQTLLVSVPGSKQGALENLEAILPSLPHGLAKLRGDSEDCGAAPLDAEAQKVAESSK